MPWNWCWTIASWSTLGPKTKLPTPRIAIFIHPLCLGVSPVQERRFQPAWRANPVTSRRLGVSRELAERSLFRSRKVTGFTRCLWKPASRLRRTSSSVPEPAHGDARHLVLRAQLRMRSHPLRSGRPMSLSSTSNRRLPAASTASWQFAAGTTSQPICLSTRVSRRLVSGLSSTSKMESPRLSVLAGTPGGGLDPRPGWQHHSSRVARHETPRLCRCRRCLP